MRDNSTDWKENLPNVRKIYVTVGHRFSNIPMQNKVVYFILDNDTETEIQIAKKLRKKCAEFPCDFDDYIKNQKPFKPSELYWAIFDNLDDEKPRIHSENYHEGILVSVHSFMITQ